MADDAFDWIGEIHVEINRLQREAIAAAEKAINFLYTQTLQKARQDPQWSDLADYIEMWSQDGNLVIGVRDQAFVSQAFALEYGSPEFPPMPLLRSVESDYQRAGEIMDEHLMAAYGPGAFMP